MSAADASNLLAICIALLPHIPELSEVAGRLLGKVKGWSSSVLQAMAHCENVEEVRLATAVNFLSHSLVSLSVQFLPWPSRVRMWQLIPPTFLRHSLKRSEAYLAAIGPLSTLIACHGAETERAAASKALSSSMSADVLSPLIAEGGLWGRGAPLHLALAQSTGNFMLTMLHNDLYAQTSSVVTGESSLLSALNSTARRERYKGSSVSALATHTLAGQPLRPFMAALNSAICGKVAPLQAAAELWKQLLALRDAVVRSSSRLLKKKAPRRAVEQTTAHHTASHSNRHPPRERIMVEDESDEDGEQRGGEAEEEAVDVNSYLPAGDGSIGFKLAGLACIQAACAQDNVMNTTETYVGLFQQPVVAQFPHLREKYASLIHRPMDLGTMRHKLLLNDAYENLSQVYDDASQMLANAQVFNKGDRYTVQSAERVFQAFFTIAQAAAPRLQLHLRGPFFEQDPKQEPEHLRAVAMVHRGGLLAAGLGGLGVGPYSAPREADQATEAHFRATFTAGEDKVALQEILQMCHAAAWDADDSEFVISLPDGSDYEFQITMQGCFRRPLQSTFPAMAQDILKQVTHPVDLATMLHRIQDARYASLQEARLQLTAMGEQATAVLGGGHAMLPSFCSAFKAVTAAWDAEAAFLVSRLSPAPQQEEVLAAIARREEAKRASQKATATLKAPIVQPEVQPSPAQRSAVKRSVDGTPVAKPLDPSALAAQMVRSRQQAEAAAAAKVESDRASSVVALEPYPEAVEQQRSRREFAVFQSACEALRDPRLVRVLCDALFNIAKTQVKTGTPLRESPQAALLLALMPSNAAQYAPLFAAGASTVPLLGVAASSPQAYSNVVTAQTWAGATFSTAGIMQVHLNRVALSQGPSSETANGTESVQMPLKAAISLTLPPDTLDCPPEDGLQALLRGACSSVPGWQLALRLSLPRLSSNARLAICLLRALGWATTASGSALGVPALLSTLAASVSRALVDFCPKAQAQVAASRKLVVGKVHSRLYTEAMTQHVVFVVERWMPALIQWAGCQAAASPSAAAVATQQARLHQGVPTDVSAAVQQASSASNNVWRTVVLPLLLQCWFDVAEAAARTNMSSEVQQGAFLHLFLQLGGQAAFFHAKDCLLPPPHFAAGEVLPPGTACCVSTLTQARAFRGFQYKLKAWLKRLELSALLELYDNTCKPIGEATSLPASASAPASAVAMVAPPRAASAPSSFDAVVAAPLLSEASSAFSSDTEEDAAMDGYEGAEPPAPEGREGAAAPQAAPTAATEQQEGITLDRQLPPVAGDAGAQATQAPTPQPPPAASGAGLQGGGHSDSDSDSEGEIKETGDV